VTVPGNFPAIFPLSNDDPSVPIRVNNEFITVEEGTVVLGKQESFPSFGWDNEYGSLPMFVPRFEASKYLITNAEFFDFIRSGGCCRRFSFSDRSDRDRKFWTEEGWDWRTFRNAKWPCFWVPDGPAGLHRYKLRTTFEIVPMQWKWPAVVNFHEAQAYCKWLSVTKGLHHRLLTEAEHWAIRGPQSRVDSVMHFDGPSMKQGAINLNLAYGSESAVDASSPSSLGFHDVMGNLWEWCLDHQSALPGFKIHPYYDDFTLPCFDGRHHMIMGGSFISTGDEASTFARFQFRPHFFQHCGFRVVRGSSQPTLSCMESLGPFVGTSPCCQKPSPGVDGNIYETKRMLDEYLLFHYASLNELAPYSFAPKDAWNFPQRVGIAANTAAQRYGIETKSALDLGCAVGATSFELARVFDSVLAIDLSHSFVDAGNDLVCSGRRSYLRKDEGLLFTELQAVVDPTIDRSRVRFQQGDACNLLSSIGSFDIAVLANLLCR
jgi:formylglycine-generating enzyme required for sulfatase activity